MTHARVSKAAARAIAAAFTLAAAYGFAAGEPDVPAGRIPVVATTNIVGDIVSRIGGDRLSVYVMLPPGADPHAFRATPRDARQVADAAVVFTNGAGLEADFLGDLVASAAPRRVVDLSAHLDLRRIGGEDERHADHGEAAEHGDFDPHVWMDPTLVAAWTAAIAKALAEVDPEHGADYAGRAALLAAELRELDAWVRDRVAAVPAERRILITDHDMFGYFAARYGFTVLDTVIPGFSTVAEPSARHVAALREAIAEHGVPAVFVGVTVEAQVARAVAGDLGIDVVPVYTGSLSDAAGPAASYPDFIRTNVERIVSALEAS